MQRLIFKDWFLFCDLLGWKHYLFSPGKSHLCHRPRQVFADGSRHLSFLAQARSCVRKKFGLRQWSLVAFSVPLDLCFLDFVHSCRTSTRLSLLMPHISYNCRALRTRFEYFFAVSFLLEHCFENICFQQVVPENEISICAQLLRTQQLLWVPNVKWNISFFVSTFKY